MSILCLEHAEVMRYYQELDKLEINNDILSPLLVHGLVVPENLCKPLQFLNLSHLVRSLRREASWRKAMTERRPRAAITHRFQWTLIAKLEMQL